MPFPESVKLAVKQKAHFTCGICRKAGVEVHHIIPESEGGPNTAENAAPLCPTCHDDLGANPVKQKFIRETRDYWYEVCAKRYSSDPDKIDNLIAAVHAMMAEIQGRPLPSESTPTDFRNKAEIKRMLYDLVDFVMYQEFLTRIETIGFAEEQLEARIRARFGFEGVQPVASESRYMYLGMVAALGWVLKHEASEVSPAVLQWSPENQRRFMSLGTKLTPPSQQVDTPTK